MQVSLLKFSEHVLCKRGLPKIAQAVCAFFAEQVLCECARGLVEEPFTTLDEKQKCSSSHYAFSATRKTDQARSKVAHAEPINSSGHLGRGSYVNFKPCRTLSCRSRFQTLPLICFEFHLLQGAQRCQLHLCAWAESPIMCRAQVAAFHSVGWGCSSKGVVPRATTCFWFEGVSGSSKVSVWRGSYKHFEVASLKTMSPVQ